MKSSFKLDYSKYLHIIVNAENQEENILLKLFKEKLKEENTVLNFVLEERGTNFAATFLPSFTSQRFGTTDLNLEISLPHQLNYEEIVNKYMDLTKLFPLKEKDINLNNIRAQVLDNFDKTLKLTLSEQQYEIYRQLVNEAIIKFYSENPNFQPNTPSPL